jgi:hypothetical protein
MNSDETFSEVENFVFRLILQNFPYGAVSHLPMPEIKACFDILEHVHVGSGKYNGGENPMLSLATLSRHGDI